MGSVVFGLGVCSMVIDVFVFGVGVLVMFVNSVVLGVGLLIMVGVLMNYVVYGLSSL